MVCKISARCNLVSFLTRVAGLVSFFASGLVASQPPQIMIGPVMRDHPVLSPSEYLSPYKRHPPFAANGVSKVDGRCYMEAVDEAMSARRMPEYEYPITCPSWMNFLQVALEHFSPNAPQIFPSGDDVPYDQFSAYLPLSTQGTLTIPVLVSFPQNVHVSSSHPPVPLIFTGHDGPPESQEIDDGWHPPLPPPPPRMPATCDRKVMEAAIDAAKRTEFVMSFKNRFGNRPSDLDKTSRTLLANDAYIRKLIGTKATTLALVYGYVGGKAGRKKGNEKKCVWLMSADRVMAGAALPSDAELEDIWSGLDVDIVGRSVSPMRARRRGESCPNTASKERLERSPEKVEHAWMALKKLSEALLPAPVRTALEASSDFERLVIVPVKDFRALPFSALTLGKDTLIDRFSIIIASGASGNFDVSQNGRAIRAQGTSVQSSVTGAPTERKENEFKFLVVGNPDLTYDRTTYCWADLPHAENEAVYVSSLLGVRPILGPAADFAAVTSHLREGQQGLKIIFFATHGISDSINPADGSFLALNRRHLRGADLRNYRFEAKPLVVMSACETGLGKTFADGMFGLAEAWRFAGARQVIMSLWDVDDEGTSALMASFIRHFQAQALIGPEYALARAIREVKVTYPDPAIWAAFSVLGQPTPDW